MFWGLQRCKEQVVRKTLEERRCEKDVVRNTLWERRCEKDVFSTDSSLISYVFQWPTAVKVAEDLDLISFTDLLVYYKKNVVSVLNINTDESIICVYLLIFCHRIQGNP